MSVVWITGASSGLGAHLALELARRGHRLGLVARRASALDELCGRIAAAGGEAHARAADVTDRASLASAFTALEEVLGPADVCVANAGVDGRFDVRAIGAEAIAHTFAVNVFGAIATAELVLPSMLARDRGLLVVVSSVAATRGLTRSATYSASKAAITTFWEGMRVDLHATGVDCLTIHPGFVRTPMTSTNDFAMPFLLEPEDAARRMADAIEARRRTLTFPLPFRLAEALMKVAPAWLFDPLLDRLDGR